MNIDESKLKPFDLERAKAGDKVLAKNADNDWTTVLSSTFEEDANAGTTVLLSTSQGRCWYQRRFKDLRMAPKMRTVWYGLVGNKEGGIYAASGISEQDVNERAKAIGGYELLAIHSIEVPE